MAGWLRKVLFAAALSPLLPLAAAARPTLLPQRLDQLLRCEVLLQSEPAGLGLQRHRASGLFDATPEDIFRVATSYDRYSEYMPRITSSQTLWQGVDESVVLIEADLPWPMADSWVHARFQHDQPEGGAYRVRFAMLRGNVHRYEGMLLIEAYGPGRALVTYEIVAQPDSRIPRAWLQGAVGRGALNFVHCLRARVSVLQQRGALLGPLGATLYPMHLRPREEAPDDSPRATRTSLPD